MVVRYLVVAHADDHYGEIALFLLLLLGTKYHQSLSPLLGGAQLSNGNHRSVGGSNARVLL